MKRETEIVQLLANPWIAYSLLILVGFTGAIADIWVYEWSRTDRSLWMLLGCVAWVISLVLFGVLLKADGAKFSSVFMLASIFHVVLVLICDLVWYGTRFNKLESIGLILAIVAVLLLELGKEQATELPLPAAVEQGEQR